MASTISTFTGKTLFPCSPPPTTNDLTAEQRSVLSKKSRKIEQILGATPHLVDAPYDGPIHVAFPYGTQRSTSSCGSSDSGSSSSSNTLQTFTRSTPTSSTKERRKKRPTTAPSDSRKPAWPKPDTMPVLRLSVPSLTFHPVSQPPPSIESVMDAGRVSISSNASDSSSEGPTSSSEDVELHPALTTARVFERKHALTTDDIPSRPISNLSVTSFMIPSASSIRKAKMDRLRRKLGTKVPLELVFPDGIGADVDGGRVPDVSPSSVVAPTATQTVTSDSATSSTPVITQGSPPSNAEVKVEVAGSAENIVEEPKNEEVVVFSEVDDADEPAFPPALPRPKVQKAPRILSASDIASTDSATIYQARRAGRDVRTVPRHRKAKLATSTTPATIHADFKRVKEKLSFIEELPEEHIVSLPMPTTNESDSDWSSRPSTADTVHSGRGVDLWFEFEEMESRRKKFEYGSPLVSPTTSTFRKRPSSYRKPPPPIPDDLKLVTSS